MLPRLKTGKIVTLRLNEAILERDLFEVNIGADGVA